MNINRREFIKILTLFGISQIPLFKKALALTDQELKLFYPTKLDKEYEYSEKDLDTYHEIVEKVMRHSKKTGEYSIVVDKSEHSLNLIKAGKLYSEYHIELGANPYSDKKIVGDFCTPEGLFYICQKNPNSRYFKSLALSYPNKEHAQRGLKEKLINSKEAKKIISSINERKIPLWNTKLGGEIFIHGSEFGEKRKNWTDGCIALSNYDIEEIYNLIPARTQVAIVRYGTKVV